MKKLLPIIILIISFSACSVSSQKPASTEQDLLRIEVSESVKSLLAKKYQGWVLQGSTLDISEVGISNEITFDAHLAKDGKNRVVTIIIKKFTKDDGKEYWLAYPATKLRIGNMEINAEREKAVETEKQKEDELRERYESEEAF